MHDNLYLPMALALSAVSLTGQSIVTPPGATNTHTNQVNAVPWGWPSPTSTQGEVFFQQIDDALLGIPRVLKGFAFRHRYSDTISVPWNYTVTIKMGDAATAAQAMSAVYANNWKVGGMSTTVLNGTVTFPAVPAYPRPPGPFDAPAPFQVPHVYIGTNPLLWELYITSTVPAVAKIFHDRGATGATMTAGPIGLGCTITGGAAAMASTGSMTASALTDTLTNGPASMPVALLLGDESDKLGGALPLPFDLGVIGSSGCYVHINPLVNFPMTAGATGGATFSLPYVMTPTLSGIRLRTQWGSVDSAFLVRTSNGLDHCIPYAANGMPWPQNTYYSSNFGATPPASGTNYLSGIITRWSI